MKYLVKLVSKLNSLLKNNKIDYEFLYLRKDTDDINKFKSDIKCMLAEGNDIITIMSVGDNILDINGECSGYWLKLPNQHDPNLYHLNNLGIPEAIDYS